MQTQENQGIQANDNENLQIGYSGICEPQILDKNQGVRLKNLTPLQIGEKNEAEIATKNIINFQFFLAHREEILVMKEQVELIRCMMKAG